MLFTTESALTQNSHGYTPAPNTQLAQNTNGIYRMPPNMVAGRFDHRHLQPSLQHYPNIVTRQAPTKEPPTLPKWNPRTGHNTTFIKWYDALVSAENDLDIDIDEQKPSFDSIPYHITQSTTPPQLQYIIDLTNSASQLWQDDSNTLFDMIKTSLILEGHNLERDLHDIAAFAQLKIKDGRALRACGLSHRGVSYHLVDGVMHIVEDGRVLCDLVC